MRSGRRGGGWQSGAPRRGLYGRRTRTARARTTGGALEPVAKAGGDKATVGGWKGVARRHDEDGLAIADVLYPWGEPAPPGTVPLQVHAIAAGERRHTAGLAEATAHHQRVVRTLPPHALDLDPGEPAVATDPLPRTSPTTPTTRAP